MKRALIIIMIAGAACSKTDRSDLALASPPVIVKPDELVRIAGAAAIQPDADTAKAMVSTGHTRVITSWKLCVDPTGAPDEVSAIRSSGFVTWDAALAAGMRAWRFKPVVKHGEAVRACTAYTFAWSAS